MKKSMKFFILVLLLILGFTHNVKALSVSKNDLTIEKGSSDTVELYANVEANVTSVSFNMIYTTYDIPANFIVADGLTDSNPDGVRHVITFNEAKTGKILLGNIKVNVKGTANDTYGSVGFNGCSAKDVEGNTINLNIQNINVKVGTPTENNNTDNPTEEKPVEEPKEIDKNLLDKIESKIVKINLKKDVFEYTATINDKVEKLDLKPIVKDSNSKVEISTQKISDIKDNKITISVTNGDIKQDYIINIKIKKNVKEVTKDKDEFVDNNNYKVKWIAIIIILVIMFLASLLLTKKK